MNKTNLQRGFIPLIAIVIIAAVAIGGGAYYSKKKADKETGPKNEMTDKDNGSKELRGKSSIKALLSLDRNAKCTVSGTSADGSKVSGVTYMSGSQMKGDFHNELSNGTKIESHMIRSGNDVYVWSGANGAKMNISELESGSKAKANTSQANVDFNHDFDYECVDWSKDEATFVVPTSVNFIDVSAMMKGVVDVKAMTDIKVGN